jgi:ribosomal protein S9
VIRIAAVAALASLAVLVPAAQGTTEPVEEVDVYVTIRDSGITLSRKEAVRGAVARFIVHNLGKKPHSFELGKGNVTAVRTGLSTRVMRPKSRVKILLVFLDFRGALPYRSTVPADARNPRMRGVFTIT